VFPGIGGISCGSSRLVGTKSTYLQGPRSRLGLDRQTRSISPAPCRDSSSNTWSFWCGGGVFRIANTPSWLCMSDSPPCFSPRLKISAVLARAAMSLSLRVDGSPSCMWPHSGKAAMVFLPNRLTFCCAFSRALVQPRQQPPFASHAL
jgi:hypothetical protein